MICPRKSRWWCFGAIFIGAVLQLACLGADSSFVIAARGQAEAEIVVEATQPEPPMAFAAQELQRYVKEMSGAELRVVAQPSRRRKTRK